MTTRREILLGDRVSRRFTGRTTARRKARLRATTGPKHASAQPVARGRSLYPTSHFNPGATDSGLFAGPVNGRHLAPNDVKNVPTVITSNPAIKKVGAETIAFASGAEAFAKSC